MKKNYIQALLEMINEGKDVTIVLEGLSKTLAAKGHTRLHASVLRGVLRVLETQSSSPATSVAVVSEADAKKFATIISQALHNLGADGDFVTKVDDSLVGGFVAEHNNVIIDTSYKAKLVSLYRKMT